MGCDLGVLDGDLVVGRWLILWFLSFTVVSWVSWFWVLGLFEFGRLGFADWFDWLLGFAGVAVM